MAFTREDAIAALTPIIEKARAEIYSSEYKDKFSKEEVLGVIIAKFSEWDGDAIIKITEAALEDANYHTEATAVKEAFEQANDAAWEASAKAK